MIKLSDIANVKCKRGKWSVSFKKRDANLQACLYLYLYEIGIRYENTKEFIYEDKIIDRFELNDILEKRLFQDLLIDVGDKCIGERDVRNAMLESDPIIVNPLFKKILKGEYYYSKDTESF